MLVTYREAGTENKAQTSSSRDDKKKQNKHNVKGRRELLSMYSRYSKSILSRLSTESIQVTTLVGTVVSTINKSIQVKKKHAWVW